MAAGKPFYIAVVNTQSYTGAAATATLNALLYNPATTLVRPVLTSWSIGCRATPAEQACTCVIGNTTAAPTTGTGGAGNLGRPADLGVGTVPASSTLGYSWTGPSNISAGATFGSSLVVFGLHQKASFKWVPNPGEEPSPTATLSNGLSFSLNNATASAAGYDMTISYAE